MKTYTHDPLCPICHPWRVVSFVCALLLMGTGICLLTVLK